MCTASVSACDTPDRASAGRQDDESCYMCAMAGLRCVAIVGCVVALAACGSVRPSAGGSVDGGVDGSADSLGDGGMVALLPPSCVGLTATCGDSGNDGCCNSALVAGG